MDKALEDKITAILESQEDMTIATVRSDGYPQATTVKYVSEGLAIYFGCPGGSQKAWNLARDNKVSLAINVPYREWDEIQGLSIGGLADQVIEPAELDHLQKLMLGRFPQIARYGLEHLKDLVFFRITPEVISVVDYTKGFGHTDLVKIHR